MKKKSLAVLIISIAFIGYTNAQTLTQKEQQLIDQKAIEIKKKGGDADKFVQTETEKIIKEKQVQQAKATQALDQKGMQEKKDYIRKQYEKEYAEQMRELDKAKAFAPKNEIELKRQSIEEKLRKKYSSLFN